MWHQILHTHQFKETVTAEKQMRYLTPERKIVKEKKTVHPPPNKWSTPKSVNHKILAQV